MAKKKNKRLTEKKPRPLSYIENLKKTDEENEDAYARGADACLAGEDETNNPYPVKTPEGYPDDNHAAWHDGYSHIAWQDENDSGNKNEKE